ncbi:hypothetical protein D1164_23415 [Mariniphaga sediminis]|uniref:Uncharacterized protein n=1 Tax=Mariniphaga sediminis TaxID=1628158 RepID=A0A399CTI3_9BACT|nr:hypothetical protein [Mariniphaga sediminis]RIH62733.1 hypothetical protein D1164_23415 [Mariniphaga sediminis]
MKILIATIIFLTIILSLNYGQAQNSLEDSIIIEVINTTIQSQRNDTIYKPNGTIWKIKENKTPQLVLLNKTETFLFDPKFSTLEMFNRNGLSLLDSVTFKDFILRNETSIILPEIENEQASIHILTKEELNDIFERGGWGKISSKI